jgi:hypothetical protein
MREFRCQCVLPTPLNIRFLASDTHRNALNLAKFGYEGNPIWDLSGIVLGLQ